MVLFCAVSALFSSMSDGGGTFRSIMLGTQFTISIFMLAMVMIVFFQNKKEAVPDFVPASVPVQILSQPVTILSGSVSVLVQVLSQVLVFRQVSVLVPGFALARFLDQVQYASVSVPGSLGSRAGFCPSFCPRFCLGSDSGPGLKEKNTVIDDAPYFRVSKSLRSLGLIV